MSPNSPTHKKYTGQGVSDGKVTGKVLFFSSRNENISKETTDDAAFEVIKLQEATQSVDEEFQNSINYYENNNRPEEKILAEARRLLLFDIVETNNCKELILENNYTARRAVFEAATNARLSFENLEDDFMRERVDDIKQVSEMLLYELGGVKRQFPHLTEPVIIVAEELIPEGTLCFEKNNILGIVVKNATYNSHSSILARLWSIPAITSVDVSKEWDNKTATLDGTLGTIEFQ